MPLKRLLAISLFTAIGSAAATASLAADKAWTMRDLDAVADAALATLTDKDSKLVQASKLNQLTEALMKAGDFRRARAVVDKAIALLDPSHDASSSTQHQNLIRYLVRLGDESTAETLANVRASLPIKADLLGELGAGKAANGNIASAQLVARRISALGPSADPMFETSSARAMRKIAIALGEAGDVDDAITIASNLNDKTATAEILARTATTLCLSKHSDKGRDLATRAANEARTAAATIDKPYMMFKPIEDVAEAITTCEGLTAAATFVRDALPPQTEERAVSTLVDHLSDHQAALAVALTPPPKADDADGYLLLAKRLRNSGDLATAKNAAIQASRIASNESAVKLDKSKLGRVHTELCNLGEYDAALAVTKLLPAAERAVYQTVALTAAIEHRDSPAVDRLLPEAIEAVNSTGSIRILQMNALLQLSHKLATNGYQVQARLFAQALLSTLDDHATTPNAIRRIEIAKLQANMGDISGAIQTANGAGPLAAKPSMFEVAALTAIQFGGATKLPTNDEMKSAIERTQATLPSQVPGPKARALTAIAIELAARQDIEDAWQVEAELDVEPREVLIGPRDTVLVAISGAQVKTGDLPGALSTTLKITQADSRWQSLLKLAAQPPRS